MFKYYFFKKRYKPCVAGVAITVDGVIIPKSL